MGIRMSKAPMELLPPNALEEIANVFGFGLGKHGRLGFQKGKLPYSTFISKIYRHLGQFNSGQDLDDESKANHIAAVGANAMMLLWLIKYRPDLDDRWIKLLEKEMNNDQ